MKTAYRSFVNLYRDSVALMRISAEISARDDVDQAFLMMATPANLELLSDAGFAAAKIKAGPNDLVAVVRANTAKDADRALAEAHDMLMAGARSNQDGSGNGVARPRPHSLAAGQEILPQANLALISCPGDYAAAEAEKALGLGLHVMIFSDNVAIEDEARLKALAAKRSLMVMGPDCGTAMIGGVALGFANQVASGDIGIVAASGTGAQQAACLIDRLGCGVSHVLGTGGRDLSAKIGGLTMIAGIEALAADNGTRVIVLISKPPAPDVAKKVLGAAAKAARAGKPVVVNFLGADKLQSKLDGIFPVSTLHEAAIRAVELSSGRKPEPLTGAAEDTIEQEAARLGADQKYIRGLFSGGTFSYEALLLLGGRLGSIHSSTPLDPSQKLADSWTSTGHCVVDLGDDEFTRGRPHPMIDHRLRNERLLKEAMDPETAVILFDLVLGYGAHQDAAGEMAPAIEGAREAARAQGRELVFVASVCGTDDDPQGFRQQEDKLRKAGTVLAPSNAEAALLAAAIIERHAAARKTSEPKR
jgi:succinyl-CoA synthetase alpha subunit